MLSLQNIMDVKLLSIKNATKYQHDALWVLTWQNIILCLLVSLLNHSVEPGCSLGAFKSRFHVSFIHECPSDLIKFLNCLQEVAPDSSIYNAVIHGLCLRGKIGLANRVYAKMRSIGLIPDGKTRAFMLQYIATD